jgi:hypothetical protein
MRHPISDLQIRANALLHAVIHLHNCFTNSQSFRGKLSVRPNTSRASRRMIICCFWVHGCVCAWSFAKDLRRTCVCRIGYVGRSKSQGTQVPSLAERTPPVGALTMSITLLNNDLSSPQQKRVGTNKTPCLEFQTQFIVSFSPSFLISLQPLPPLSTPFATLSPIR